MSARYLSLPASLLALVCLSNSAFAHDFTIGSLSISHPWSRATPAKAPVAGGYVTITNNGAVADRLISISSPLAERVEIHESTVSEGIASMRPLPDGIPIDAGGTVELQPGKAHLMFMQPTQTLEKGERFAATLTFEKAGSIDVEFAVEAMGHRPLPTDEHNGHGAPAE